MLYKTTLVIWTDFDPGGFSLADLGWEADRGDAYCSQWSTSQVEDPKKDPDWDGTEFFGIDEEDEEEECAFVKEHGPDHTLAMTEMLDDQEET